jgi:branched-chain amino acid aminotransferase
MLAYVNGTITSFDQAVIPVSDRGFLYGDALFETLLVWNSHPFRLREHLERLERGIRFLRFKQCPDVEEIRRQVMALLAADGAEQAVLRITLTRGCGQRGYGTGGAGPCFLLITLYPVAGRITELHQWRLKTSTCILNAGDPFCTHKTTNKLVQVAARMEAEDAGVDEALLLNNAGHVVETASANVFWVEDGALCAPPRGVGGLPGITSALVVELCGSLKMPFRERWITPQEITTRDGVFCTLSTLGIVEVVEVDGTPVSRSPLTDTLSRVLWERIGQETAAAG